jgi:hypothetical protein
VHGLSDLLCALSPGGRDSIEKSLRVGAGGTIEVGEGMSVALLFDTRLRITLLVDDLALDSDFRALVLFSFVLFAVGDIVQVDWWAFEYRDFAFALFTCESGNTKSSLWMNSLSSACLTASVHGTGAVMCCWSSELGGRDWNPSLDVAIGVADPLCIPSRIHSGLSTERFLLKRVFDMMGNFSLGLILHEASSSQNEIEWSLLRIWGGCASLSPVLEGLAILARHYINYYKTK